MKKIFQISIVLTLVIMLFGCQQKYTYYTKTFVGAFDTVTTYITYAKSEDEFNKQCELIEKDLDYYDHLFDKYNSYDDISNVKTINDNAGKKAVEVDQPLIDLLNLCIERNRTISSKVNIAFGSVIDIWHDYREQANAQNGVGKVPEKEELENANQHTDISDIVVDNEKKTVYIKDESTSIDVGATAKGYAVELIKQDLIKMGVESFLLSGGGNVASYGKRLVEKNGDFYLDDCHENYCIGIESPKDGNYSQSNQDPDGDNEAILVVQGESVVTSGDYQRFYQSDDGIKYHHLIDPDTLYPAVYFRSVSIVCEDSGLADFLSSAVFLMSYEDGLKLINSLDGVEAIWLLEDGKIKMSDGLKDNQNVYVFEKNRLK